MATKSSIRNVAMQTNVNRTTIKNVSDLKELSLDVDIEDRIFGSGDQAFTVTGFEMDNVFYRIPKTVLSQIKMLLEDNIDLERVKIKKVGTGMQTQYLVTPM